MEERRQDEQQSEPPPLLPPRVGYPRDELRARLRDLGFPGVQHHERVLRRLLSENRRAPGDDAGPDELAAEVIVLALKGVLRSGPSFSVRRGPWRRLRRPAP